MNESCALKWRKRFIRLLTISHTLSREREPQVDGAGVAFARIIIYYYTDTVEWMIAGYTTPHASK
jgi:hypothetical protein